ncbi:MAG: hypothetical protein mread185_000301 [Mycoplasmataceae bacterium]|nr:MAG: hypothetical protein mread185_000301 [Mycoplasmataceae bacterium]
MIEKKREKKMFYFLLISHFYCLISGWFNGDRKINYINSYFWHFLGWWCVWNSILTIFFLLWKWKNPKSDTYFSKIFSLITMISNFITILIYGVGVLIWIITIPTNYLGITHIEKAVPIPTHEIKNISKVIQWWAYSPLWHFIAPTYFIVWFFRNEKIKLLKEKIKLTIFLSLIQPVFYFSYCYLRSKLGDREYFYKFNARWNLSFLSPKRMAAKIGLSRDYRFVWIIILAIFWFTLFSLIVHLTLRYQKKIKDYLSNKKEKLISKVGKIPRFN